ncbi:hypothetical protein PAECIP111802_03449 [Paenibacillus allorhizosphaerae]|uniref:Uncharacterized protein n=1 Tax=Paenibacillus allorhizosphaerae TaxID=2849866 RepID=A0ABM8VJA2_9BACL|nr:hypothetical protein PAECIP111802_03449 [Paenibacillus allorhizosphaerae]
MKISMPRLTLRKTVNNGKVIILSGERGKRCSLFIIGWRNFGRIIKPES